MRRRTTTWMVCICLCAAAAAGCDDEPEADPDSLEAAPTVESFDPEIAARLPEGRTVEMASEGRELFVVCATCHGLDAGGTQLAPSLRDGEWIHGSGEIGDIERIIREGVPEPEEFPIPMPPGGGGEFDQEQVQALAAFVYAISGSRATAQPTAEAGTP